MENVSNISSEEELLQLRNEGKISEDEYDQLRGHCRKARRLILNLLRQRQISQNPNVNLV